MMQVAKIPKGRQVFPGCPLSRKEKELTRLCGPWRAIAFSDGGSACPVQFTAVTAQRISLGRLERVQRVGGELSVISNE